MGILTIYQQDNMAGINLFDFSKTINPIGQIGKTTTPVQWATGGWIMPPTTNSQTLPETPQVQPTIQPQAGNDILSKFYNDSAITTDKKKMLSVAIGKGMPRKDAEDYVSKTFYTSWVGDYFTGLAWRIWEWIAQVPSDIINVWAESIGSDFRAQPISQSLFWVTPSSEKV